MSQPMPLPRPRARLEDTYAEPLPKRVPGAALHAVPGARAPGPVEEPPPLTWTPYPAQRRRNPVARAFAAVRRRLRRR